MASDLAPPPSRGGALIPVGVGLVVLGIATFVVFVAIVAAGDDPEPWRALVWIGAALAIGVGLALIAYGVAKRRRRASQSRIAGEDRGADRGSDSRGPDDRGPDGRGVGSGAGPLP